MPTTKEVSGLDNFHARILLYGPSQSGKTTFIGTMPEDRDDHKGRFIINLEQKNLLPLFMKGKKFEWEDVKDYEHLLKILVSLRSRFDKKDPTCPATVALDGGGECYTQIMRYILKNAGVEQPQIQHYLTAQERMKTIINELINLPCHVIITFHDILDKDEMTGEILGNLAIPGKYLPGDIMKRFNMVLHTEVDVRKDKEGEYKLCTMRTRRYPAGDKTGALEYYEVPDFNQMMEKVKKKVKESISKS